MNIIHLHLPTVPFTSHHVCRVQHYSIDGSGNAFAVTQTNVSTNVIIDTVNPESSNLTIYSNNSRTDLQWQVIC